MELEEFLNKTMSGYPHIGYYIDDLIEMGFWTEITSTKKKLIAWLENQFALADWGYLGTSDPRMLDAIAKIAPSPRRVFHIAENVDVHLDYLDALAAVGMGWKMVPEDISFYSWLEEHHRDLRHLVNNRNIRPALLSALDMHLDSDFNESYDADLATLLANPVTRQLVVDKLDQMAQEHIYVTGSGIAWKLFLTSYKKLNCPELQELNPDALATLFRFNPAEELATRLNRGTFVEYTWPELEQALEAAGEDAVVTSNFPWVGVAHGTTLALFGGDEPTTHTIPGHEHLSHAVPVGDDLYLQYNDPDGPNYWWASTNTRTVFDERAEEIDEFFCDFYILDGHVYLGDVELTPGATLDHQPGGRLFGQHELYHRNVGEPGTTPVHVFHAADIDSMAWKDFDKKLRARKLPGVSFYPEGWKKAPRKLTFNFDSFIRPASPDTSDSPLGSDNGLLYNFIFGGEVEGNSVVFSPLGRFEFNLLGQIPLRRPGGGIWSAVEAQLFDDTTGSPITPSLTATGQQHPLQKLTVEGLHYLKVRNQEASERMRDCTREQAKELLDDPTKILTFAENDEILAAAIAGIIAEIAAIEEFGVELPALDQVPDYLEYLYSS